jgi:accessory colonization factor AcfC
MKEAAAVFGQAHAIDVQVTAGPTPQWIDHAKSDADLIFSGSEVMMSDFITAIPEIDPATVHPLFLRPVTILSTVRSGPEPKSSHHSLPLPKEPPFFAKNGWLTTKR